MIRELYLFLWAVRHRVKIGTPDRDEWQGNSFAVLRFYRGRFNQCSSIDVARGTFGQFRRQLNFLLTMAERAITRAEQMTPAN